MICSKDNHLGVVIMKKFLTMLLLSAMTLCFATSAMAASITLNVDSLAYNADDKQDLIGAAGSRTADGKYDASFTIDVSGAQAIKEIALKNETTGKSWSTSPSGTTELLLVQDANGAVVNKSSRMPVTPVLLAASFKLFINDAAASIAKDSTFVVTITLIDNKTATAKTSVKAISAAQTAKPETPAAATPTPQTSSSDPIVSFETRGKSAFDLAGTDEKIGANGKEDFQFDVKFSFKDMTVKGLKLTTTAGSKKAEWDTIPGNKIPLVVIIDSSKNIVNKADGSVTFAGSGEAVYSLLVHDKDGILNDPSVKTKIMITLSDGRMLEKEAVKGKKIVGDNALEAEYRGPGKYDFVGQSEKMESNMNPDRFISTAVNATGTITGVRIKDTKSGNIWDTIPSNKHPLVVVMDIKGAKLNKADGTISISVKGTTELHIGFDEENDKNTGPYQVTFVLDNGQLLETSTAAADTAAAKPTVTKAERAVKFTSAKPAVANVDLVGKSKKKGASGAKDTTLNIQLTGKGTVTAMVLAAPDGRGWDTLPSNNGRWLLGVRQGTKMLNAANGTVKIVVNGTKAYQLLMQDNGKLAAKTGTLVLTTTWGDGEVTETQLKW